jgi:hypothetical protein
MQFRLYHVLQAEIIFTGSESGHISVLVTLSAKTLYKYAGLIKNHNVITQIM